VGVTDGDEQVDEPHEQFVHLVAVGNAPVEGIPLPEDLRLAGSGCQQAGQALANLAVLDDNVLPSEAGLHAHLGTVQAAKGTEGFVWHSSLSVCSRRRISWRNLSCGLFLPAKIQYQSIDLCQPSLSLGRGGDGTDCSDSILLCWFIRGMHLATSVFGIRSDGVLIHGPYEGEKLVPILSLFTVDGREEGLALCKRLLAREGAGHTAIIHTQDPHLAERYGLEMPVSRILVNTSGSQGCCGMSGGLMPSAVLGCGTLGGGSTSDNVTYTHLRNIKRVAHAS
jgi:hypothetical protein